MGKPDDDPLLAPGFIEALPEEERESLFRRSVAKLERAMDEDDANGVKMASTVITTLRRFVGDKDALKVKFPQPFLDAVHHMAQRQFSVPSRLKPLLRDEKKNTGG